MAFSREVGPNGHARLFASKEGLPGCGCCWLMKNSRKQTAESNSILVKLMHLVNDRRPPNSNWTKWLLLRRYSIASSGQPHGDG